MEGQWQGLWQGQWQGATVGPPGSMSGLAVLSLSGSGTLVGVVVQSDDLHGRVRAYYDEQERIAELIRSQNQAIVAAVVALALAGDFE